MAKQKTGPQLVHVGVSNVNTDQGAVSNQQYTSAWYKKARVMRKDPTIALVRQLFFAPILSSAWSFEETDDSPEGAVDEIKTQLNRLKFELVRTSLVGCTDFGWQGYEKVLESDGVGSVRLSKVKPLLQDFTEIRIEEDNGAYAGLRQEELLLSAEETLLVAFDVEGTDWYGRPIMGAAETPYDMWSDANAAAKRYDTKIAGVHWVVHYPLGESEYNGTQTSNATIAKEILDALEASGKIIVPRMVQEYIDGQPEDAWKIELLSASGGASFEARLGYLDALKVRAFGFPERSILEGQYGTKAEAGEHGDFAITNLELRHQQLINYYNKYLVNHMLRLNWGPAYEDTVFIKPMPLADEERWYLKQLYTTIMSNPEGFLQEIDNIDLEAMRDRLGIPSDFGMSVADLLNQSRQPQPQPQPQF